MPLSFFGATELAEQKNVTGTKSGERKLRLKCVCVCMCVGACMCVGVRESESECLRKRERQRICRHLGDKKVCCRSNPLAPPLWVLRLVKISSGLKDFHPIRDSLLPF